MMNAGTLRGQPGPVEGVGWVFLLALIVIVLLLCVAALHDRMAKPAVTRVSLRAVLSDATAFFVLYWQRAPAPIILTGILGLAAVWGLRDEPGLLLIAGFVGAPTAIAMGLGAALRVGAQDLYPDDVEWPLRPLGFQFEDIESRVLGAVLILGAMLVLADLATSLSTTLLFHANASLEALAGLIALVGFVALYVVGRLNLFALRAGLGHGFSLGRSWDLTRGALLPAAVAFLTPMILILPLGFAIDAVWFGLLDQSSSGPGAAIAAFVALVLAPLGWGAQIATLRVLESTPASRVEA